jgi:hypothetical protein
MRLILLLSALGLAVHASSIVAQPKTSNGAPISRQLRGLDAAQANALVTSLKGAQRDLQAGKAQSFELLAGSVASYDAARITPRDAFLQLPFDKVWDVERISAAGEPLQEYKLAYSPEGLGKPYWHVEVATNSSNDIERVLLSYRNPPPF